ncbi:hypothetical protein [Povalibacter sp.]|uniref:hypothetical protein n=1 Tax=Povalibacter sp. TaxID=1962978 RepID=UPI002F42F4CE
MTSRVMLQAWGAVMCFAAMTGCERDARPPSAAQDSTGPAHWQHELDRAAAIRSQLEQGPLPDANRQVLALANNDQIRGIALGHLRRYPEALEALASAQKSLAAVWEKSGCESASASATCRDAAHLRTITYSLRGSILEETGDRVRSRAAFRDAVITARSLDEFERSLLTCVRGMIAADAFGEAAELLATEITAANADGHKERLKTVRGVADSFVRSLSYGVSWTAEGSLRGSDPRDFADNTGMGIGRQIKYGMTDQYEDDATFFTVMALEELMSTSPPDPQDLARMATDGGYASTNEFLESVRVAEYARREMLDGNFEPAAKYMVIDLLTFAFDDKLEPPKCPAAPRVASFDVVRQRLLEAPAGTVAPTTVEILLAVERLAAVACIRSHP